MGETAGAGAEIAGPAAAEGIGKGAAEAAPSFIDAGASTIGETAGALFGGGGGAGDLAAGASPWVIDSPISAGAFDYLGAGGGADLASSIAPDLITSNASLTTPGGFSGSPIDFSGAGGQPLGAGSGASPFAAGGTTVAGATPDIASAASSPALSAPSAAPGAAAAAPAASVGGAADATSSWFDKLLSGASKSITGNPIGLALGAGGLGYNILQGQKSTANQAALSDAASKAAGTSDKLATAGIAQVGTNQNNASEIAAKGKDLEQYLTTGQLPAQYTQQIDQAINDAKTTAISNAAKNGQPTDPTKNTSLAQQLAQIDNQRAGMTSKIAETLFNAGAGLTNTAANVGNASASSLLGGGQQAAGLSGQLYTTLTGIDSKQSEQTAKAIAALAQSLNSGTPQKQAA